MKTLPRIEGVSELTDFDQAIHISFSEIPASAGARNGPSVGEHNKNAQFGHFLPQDEAPCKPHAPLAQEGGQPNITQAARTQRKGMKDVEKHNGKSFAEPTITASGDRRPPLAASGGRVVVAFPCTRTAVARDMEQLGGHLRDLAAAVHSGFLATFATIPQNLLVAAAELIANRRQDDLAAHWRETLHLYVESLETGQTVVDNIARAHRMQRLGRHTRDSIQRISAIVLGELIPASHSVDNDVDLSSLFDRLSSETAHFTNLLAELRRRAGRYPTRRLETNSAP